MIIVNISTNSILCLLLYKKQIVVRIVRFMRGWVDIYLRTMLPLGWGFYADH